MPFADLTDVRCRYEIMGHGDPLLMIEGLGATCEKWGSVAHQLAESFTLILLDNRNMGQSVARRDPQNLADLTADLVELLDHLQLDRAHVLGLSLGGIIAQRLAIDHPSRVDRLVLVSCTNRFGPYLRQMAGLLEVVLRRFPFEAFRRTMEVLGTSPGYFDTHAVEIEAAIKACGNSNEHRLSIARQFRCLGCDEVAPPNEYRIQSPTLVVAGERDMLIPSVYARRMAGEIPGSEFYSIPECGHDPLQERPEVVIPRIVEFLSQSKTISPLEGSRSKWVPTNRAPIGTGAESWQSMRAGFQRLRDRAFAKPQAADKHGHPGKEDHEIKDFQSKIEELIRAKEEAN